MNMKRALMTSLLFATAASWWLACGTQSSDLDGAGSIGTGPGGGGPGGAGQGGQGGQGGETTMHPGVLVDRGLIARYYLDEAESGQEPVEALDAASNPVPLAITYDDDPVTQEPYMTYTTDADGNSGLTFSEIKHWGRASVDVDQTKIAMMLQGGTAMSYELVADIEAVSSSYSRLLHIGAGSDHRLSFETNDTTFLQLQLDNHPNGDKAAVYLPDLGRAEYHAVLDSTQPEPIDRVQFYANGSPLQTLEHVLPLGAQMDLGLGSTFVIGNREIGERSIEGTIYYAALYNVALSPSDVIQNAALLLIDDDTPEP